MLLVGFVYHAAAPWEARGNYILEYPQAWRLGETNGNGRLLAKQILDLRPEFRAVGPLID